MSKFEHASSGREMVCLANSNDGPCHLLGPLVGETRFHFIYRTRTSSRAYVPKRLARLLYTVAAGLEGDGEEWRLERIASHRIPNANDRNK